MAAAQYSPASSREAAFFYVDGIPTKGAWLGLDDVQTWDDVQAALHRLGLVGPHYGGDILVADIEGSLALCCYSSSSDHFDLDRFSQLQEDISRHNLDTDAVVAFIGWYGVWNADAFESVYIGRYDSEEAYAEQYLEDSGLLESIPDSLRIYFDVERFARDLFIDGYYFDAGFVFCTNC